MYFYFLSLHDVNPWPHCVVHTKRTYYGQLPSLYYLEAATTSSLNSQAQHGTQPANHPPHISIDAELLSRGILLSCCVRFDKKDGYRQLNVRKLGSLRPWDHRGKCYMDRKRIQCLLKHRSMYPSSTISDIQRYIGGE